MANGSGTYELVIAGGGLAGLSLALQVRRSMPHARIALVELAAYPAPKGAHKVGESTVQIAAHYLKHTLDLQEHLEKEHLPKFDLRYFMGSGHLPFHERLEIGVRQYLPTPSYQLDRGILENHLFCEAGKEDIEFFRPASVRTLHARPGDSLVEIRTADGRSRSLRTRWFVDATGRAGLIRRGRAFAQSGSGRQGFHRKVAHRASAAWFRIDKRVDVSDWSQDLAWHEGHEGLESRWYSTNHLMGTGYWIWLIPLAGNRTSIGVVREHSVGPFSEIAHYDSCLRWIAAREPHLGKALEGECPLDFKVMKDYSYGSQTILSREGWALTGEAAVFPDPFYSPGSDFIAIGNTLLTDLIVRVRTGREQTRALRLYEVFLQESFDSFMDLYEGRYSMWGNPLVMPLKIVWDFAVYWTFIAYFFCHGRLADPEALLKARPRVQRIRRLNTMMQDLFSAWHSSESPGEARGRLTTSDIPLFWHLNETLTSSSSEAAFWKGFAERTELLERLASEVVHYCAGRNPGLSLEGNDIQSFSGTSSLGTFYEEIADACSM